MKLTKAIHSDIPELVELLKALFDQEAEFEPNSEAQRKALSKIILDPKIGIILVARDDEKILGMINLLFTESTALGAKVAILEDMVVLSKYRSEGIGSQLVDYAIGEAKKEGCKRITLLTDIENTKAQSFYQKKGFVKSKMMPYRLLLD
ncbi:GNAT family N-acetyltransferase [Polynucleobacter sp. AP-Elch-400A-B2]|uniref:GNAT family N-acetyltransferase n=1 Tax=Polynucleobacter sp. AP-Elch-400A-B2 TaxID=2576930 RepID=UPI001BFCE613|nr:GNAT family N-acetyltransferase [Polynucleobacter sp. AP-Elch-400A-B2]QWE24670.1 GNAT family N-acetyltransferase [Polynucleobacter sp. AP-Elch-400A-B2]